MKALIQAKLGMLAVMLGLVGAMFGVGGVENAMDIEHVIVSIGIAATSLIIMWVGVELIKDVK